MSAGDRTGPMGQGPGTGRALGFCSGYDDPGFTKGYGTGMGRRYGFGRSRGRGMGYGGGRNSNWPLTGFHHERPWTQTISRDDEVSMLKAQAENLKRYQQDIEKRLKELEKEDK